MIKNLKKLIVGAALVLPFASFATEAKSVQPVKTEVVLKNDSHQKLEITGASKDNEPQIVAAAKEAGATTAWLNPKTNMLKVSGPFKKRAFLDSIKSLPSVSIKN